MKRAAIIVAVLFVLTAHAAYPCKMIVMPPDDKCPPDWYHKTAAMEVKLLSVTTKIDNQAAVTTVEQVFHNPNKYAVAGEYLFPLPDNANVSKFTLVAGEKQVEGKILSKEEARKLYMELMRQWNNPALLEKADERAYRASVGIVPADGEVRVKFEVVQTLALDSGMIEYSLPLGIAREHPSPVGTLSVHISISSNSPIKNIISPSHDVTVDQKDPKAPTVIYERENVSSERDFRLYYTLSKEAIGVNALSYRSGAEDGYFMLLLSPDLNAGKVVPKDIVFVIDRSGSMTGPKIKQARSALKYCLNNLNNGDRYDIISFSNEVTPFKGSLQENSTDAAKVEMKKVRDEALEYVDKIEATGGTDINAALEQAFSEIKASDRPAYIVFLTDGVPTAGDIKEPGAILANISKINTSHARIFAFGVGFGVNAVMLDRLAEESRGANEYILEEESIEVKVSRFYNKVSSPVMMDIALAVSKGVEIYDVFPDKMPDLFRGGQLVLLGRYKGGGKATITLTGKAGGEKQTYTYEENFAEKENSRDFLPRLWAMKKIAFLVSAARTQAKPEIAEGLKNQIIELSQRYGIITEFTAYLIQSNNRAIPQSGRALREPAAAAPDQVKQAGAGFEKGDGPAEMKFSRRNVGEKNAQNAEAFDALQDKDFRRAQKGRMAITGDRTFYLNDKDQYVQSTFKEKTETIKIEYMGAEYVKLLEEHPEAGRYLSLGERVIFEMAGKWYEVFVKEAPKAEAGEKQSPPAGGAKE
jgi:Ca-activated chloride channel family protein